MSQPEQIDMELEHINILQQMRKIVEEADPLPAKSGCLEDALIRVINPGLDWWKIQDPANGLSEAEREASLVGYLTHPVYSLLCKLVKMDTGQLWCWNDSHSRLGRLNLIDRAINVCITGYLSD